MQLRLGAVDSKTNKRRDMVTAKFGVTALMERPDQLPAPPKKPYCLTSARSEFEVEIHGELVGDGEGSAEGKKFISRIKMRLPVGWECIEVFPFGNIDSWQAEYSSSWAENDLLAAVATFQHQEAHFASLDPFVAARNHYWGVLKEFRALLTSEPLEEELQTFIKRNPFLLCSTYTKMWPKLPFGSKVSDFVFRDATMDYLLVELERSSHALFRGDGHPTSEMNVARGQITDWKRYIEDNLSTVRNELGLHEITSSPRSLVVIGRSTHLSPEERRKLQALNSEHPKMRIMTYDDLFESAKSSVENLLGPIWETVGAVEVYYPLQPSVH